MRHPILVAALLLAACGEERPPAPTAEQAAQLNEAEELLDREAGKEKGPESDLPGPSD
jgi:predicted outer membrane protein